MAHRSGYARRNPDVIVESDFRVVLLISVQVAFKYNHLAIKAGTAGPASANPRRSRRRPAARRLSPRLVASWLAVRESGERLARPSAPARAGLPSTARAQRSPGLCAASEADASTSPGPPATPARQASGHSISAPPKPRRARLHRRHDFAIARTNLSRAWSIEGVRRAMDRRRDRARPGSPNRRKSGRVSAPWSRARHRFGRDFPVPCWRSGKRRQVSPRQSGW